nr:hypothetical protein [Tanacetum cinerariifolium]
KFRSENGVVVVREVGDGDAIFCVEGYVMEENEGGCSCKRRTSTTSVEGGRRRCRLEEDDDGDWNNGRL